MSTLHPSIPLGSINAPSVATGAGSVTIITPTARNSVNAPAINLPSGLSGEAIGSLSTPSANGSVAQGAIALPGTVTATAQGVISGPNALSVGALSAITTPNELAVQVQAAIGAPGAVNSVAQGAIAIPTQQTSESLSTVSVPTANSAIVQPATATPNALSELALTSINTPSVTATVAQPAITVPSSITPDAQPVIVVPAIVTDIDPITITPPIVINPETGEPTVVAREDYYYHASSSSGAYVDFGRKLIPDAINDEFSIEFTFGSQSPFEAFGIIYIQTSGSTTNLAGSEFALNMEGFGAMVVYAGGSALSGSHIVDPSKTYRVDVEGGTFKIFEDDIEVKSGTYSPGLYMGSGENSYLNTSPGANGGSIYNLKVDPLGASTFDSSLFYIDDNGATLIDQEGGASATIINHAPGEWTSTP